MSGACAPLYAYGNLVKQVVHQSMRMDKATACSLSTAVFKMIRKPTIGAGHAPSGSSTGCNQEGALLDKGYTLQTPVRKGGHNNIVHRCSTTGPHAIYLQNTHLSHDLQTATMEVALNTLLAVTARWH